MLVLHLEIHPGGDAARARRLGRIEIANVSDLSPVSDYDVRVLDERGGQEARFAIFDHRRRDGAWTLVRKALQKFQVVSDGRGSIDLSNAVHRLYRVYREEFGDGYTAHSFLDFVLSSLFRHGVLVRKSHGILSLLAVYRKQIQRLQRVPLDLRATNKKY